MLNRCTPVFALALLFSSPFGSQALAQQAKEDSNIVGADQTETPAMLISAAWARLEDGVNGTKNTQLRIDAIAGFSLLGGFPRAEKLIGTTIHDADVDVRLAAIVAAGEMDKGRGSGGAFPTELRNQLNDADPKVAFTAASTLWKLGDVSGEDILAAVAQGERSGDYSFWKNSTHNASRTLHSPSALAKIAAQQGMLMLVPPVGIGMGAYGYLKGAGGLSPQVIAITQIAREHSAPVKHALIQATRVKDTGARVAAAEALATYRGDEEVRSALADLQTDSKETVRFTASAAYIRVSGAPASDQPVSKGRKR